MLKTGAMRRSGGRSKRGIGRSLLAAGVMATASLSAAAVVGVGTAGASGLGTAHPATLPAVTIGLISDGGGGSSIGTAALVEQGAKAAVAYQNEYGDGLEGHKIDLYICENQSTPAGGQTCANDMVQKGVVAVVEPFTGQGQTEVPTITARRHPLHHDQRGVDRRAHHARFLRHRRRLPGLPGCHGAERQAARLHEGRLPGRQRAGRHPGRGGARRHRLQGGRRRLHRGPGELGHGRHEPADAVGRLGRRGRRGHGRRRDVLQLVPAGLQHARPQAAQVRALDVPGPEHPRLGHARQGARRLLHHDDHAGVQVRPGALRGPHQEVRPEGEPEPQRQQQPGRRA